MKFEVRNSNLRVFISNYVRPESFQTHWPGLTLEETGGLRALYTQQSWGVFLLFPEANHNTRTDSICQDFGIRQFKQA